MGSSLLLMMFKRNEHVIHTYALTFRYLLQETVRFKKLDTNRRNMIVQVVAQTASFAVELNIAKVVTGKI